MKRSNTYLCQSIVCLLLGFPAIASAFEPGSLTPVRPDYQLPLLPQEQLKSVDTDSKPSGILS